MLSNLLKTGTKTFGYTVAGVFLTYLLQTIPAWTPTDPTQKLLWVAVGVPLLTGLVKAGLRAIRWDPEKAMKR